MDFTTTRQPLRHGLLTGCLALGSCFFLQGPASAAAPASAPAVPSGRVVARVDGEAITQAELEGAINQMIPKARVHDQARVQKASEIRKRALDLLVDRKLLIRAAKAKGVRVGDEEVAARFRELSKGLGAEASAGGHHGEGLAGTKMGRQLAVEILIQKFLDQEMAARVKVTPADVQKYYDQNRARFTIPTRVTVRQMYFRAHISEGQTNIETAKRRALEALARVRAGADFAAVAGDVSDDKATAKDGGMLGPRYVSTFQPKLREALDRAKAGENVGPIETPVGVYVLRVEDRQEPKAYPLGDVQDLIEKQLSREKKKVALRDLLAELRRSAKIVIPAPE